jgi:plasmid stabilization system protein ParE
VKAYRVVFAPEAVDQLEALYRYVAEHASAAIASRFTDAIVAACESLALFPLRGVARVDIRPGLRLTHHDRLQRVAASACVHPRPFTINAIWRISSARARRLAACSGVSAMASHTLAKRFESPALSLDAFIQYSFDCDHRARASAMSRLLVARVFF